MTKLIIFTCTCSIPWSIYVCIGWKKERKRERKSRDNKREPTSVNLNLTTKYHLIPSLFLLCIFHWDSIYGEWNKMKKASASWIKQVNDISPRCFVIIWFFHLWHISKYMFIELKLKLKYVTILIPCIEISSTASFPIKSISQSKMCACNFDVTKAAHSHWCIKMTCSRCAIKTVSLLKTPNQFKTINGSHS